MATEQEKRWWRRLKRVLNDMPESMELHVGPYGEIHAAKRGAATEAVNRDGHLDNVEEMDDLSSWRGDGVENTGSTL